MWTVNFLQQIILLFLDKIAIGALVLIIAYLINRALERYRADQAIRQETEKKRIEIIAPIFKEIGDLHFLITHKYNPLVLLSNAVELTNLKEELTKKETKAILDIRANKFWLGKVLYHKQMVYIANIGNLQDKLEKYLDAVKTGKEQEFRSNEFKKAHEAVVAAYLFIDDVLRILTHKSAPISGSS